MALATRSEIVPSMLPTGFRAVVCEVSNLLAVVTFASLRSCLLQVYVHGSDGIRHLWVDRDVCRLTGGGSDLWQLARRLTRASGSQVRLAGGTFQLH